MYSCAQCALHSCKEENPDKLPANCPMQDKSRYDEWLEVYRQDENENFYVKSAELEADGYGQWGRLKETMEFCKMMGYKRVGIAFCMGLRKEAKVIDSLFRKAGFTPVSVICKTGGIPKEAMGIAKEKKLEPDAFEAMCNPIAQAKLLNEQHTEFNILVGLCVGHDSLVNKYSTAPVTTLIAKDRVLAHNPAGAVYCAESYYKDKL
ncbi:DUF1847 domain-containing protein [Ruminococcaceae bacterium OttesenSCG-928-D13]|nr:DUF1847 domain-containing protein [Ruminococcaceae bacterium OttesenSCG-928-D13]